MKVFFTVLLFVLVLLIGVLMGAQNEQFVEVNYLLAKAEIRLSVLMAILVSFGAFLGVAAFSLVWIRLRWKISQLERKQKRSENPEVS